MSVLIFIIVLLLLVIGHEFGHFIAAKLVKIRVLEFGVGFPPKIFGKKFSPDGTEYTVNWLPFGGFVRLFGENERDAPDPGAFPNRPALHQAFVLFAGPFANMVIAVALLALALTLGSLAVVNDTNGAYLVDEPKVLVAAVLPGSPADIAGIETGDHIRAISEGLDVHLIANAEEVSRRVAESSGTVTFTLERKQETLQISVEPMAGLVESDQGRKAVGIATALLGTVAYPVHLALWHALINTGENFVYILVALVSLIGGLFTLSADVSQIAGPIGIASLTGDAAGLGFGALLSFASLLSINLAIINLLPFPALDGGRLLFLGLETVSRRKIPLGVAQFANMIGFAALILIMLAVSVQDIFRLVG